MNLRIRSAKHGVQHLSGISDGITFGELKNHLEEKTEIPSPQQRILSGFPPKPIEGKLDQTLKDLGLRNGETLTIETIPEDKIHGTKEKQDDESKTANVSKKSKIEKQNIFITEPPLMGDEGLMVRRVVEADNSCLFNSIGYVLEDRSKEKASHLRKVIAQSVADDPEIFTDVFLGKSNQAYQEWILKPDSWGGAIELSILSKYYQTEMAVLDSQSLRTDLYGQYCSYKQRVYLIYDGIHYDPLAFTFSNDLPEEMDVTIFSPKDTSVEQKASKVAKEANEKRQFTDTSNFTLRCLVCNTGLKGQKEALEHATQTAHTNFAEY